MCATSAAISVHSYTSLVPDPFLHVDTSIMKIRVAVLILATILLSGTALNINETESSDWVLFDSFMTNHSRAYPDDTELGYRFKVFQVTFQGFMT